MAIAFVVAGVLGGCGLPVGANPRPDDSSALQPVKPAGAAKWRSVDWQEVRWDRHPRVSDEQWDTPESVARTAAGFVAVGSNGNVMDYVGRIWWSADGLDWQTIDSPLLNGLPLADVAGGPSGFVAIGTRGGLPEEPPVATLLGSADGRSWREIETVAEAWGSDVAGGTGGFVATFEVGEDVDLLLSHDGAAWSRVRAGDLGAARPRIADVAADTGGWLAVGSIGDRTVVLRSPDGFEWAVEELPAAGPVKGIAKVSAYRILPGRWATLVLGLDSPPCDDDPSWCPQHQAAWSWTEATAWVRLPRSNRLLGLGHGVDAYSAGDAGFVAWAGDQLVISPDGWTWHEVAQQDRPVDVFVTDGLFADGSLVVVSSLASADEPGWFGLGTIGE